MAQEPLNSSLGQVINGNVLDAHTFQASVVTAQLFQLATDPRKTEDERQVRDNPDLEAIRRIRAEVQRLFEGAKERNVEKYRDYILALAAGETGMTPAIYLWTKDELPYRDENGVGQILVPFDVQLVAIDGETQLAARYEAAKVDPKIKSLKAAIVVCHGRPVEWARQVFYDLNTLGVQPNRALAISMDARDPLTAVARDVESAVPFFKGRVNKVRRQLKRKDHEVLTITALRGAVVTLAEGIGGVKYGARPVLVDADRIPAIRQVATEWFTAVADVIGPAIEDRERTLAGAPPVMAAVGAMGHELIEIKDTAARERKMAELLDRLRLVRWEKSKKWEGVAGKFTPKGNFSIGGTKETAYAIYAALNDRSSEAYGQIRVSSIAAA